MTLVISVAWLAALGTSGQPAGDAARAQLREQQRIHREEARDVRWRERFDLPLEYFRRVSKF